MDNPLIDRIRVLKTTAKSVSVATQNTLRGVGKFKYDDPRTPVYEHDNVRVVESDSEHFNFDLIRNKHQVVVILSGEWTMCHGETRRAMTVSDVIKVPIGSSVQTSMSTEQKGAKFVYIQFK